MNLYLIIFFALLTILGGTFIGIYLLKKHLKENFLKLNSNIVKERRLLFYQIQDFIQLNKRLPLKYSTPYFSTEWSISSRFGLILDQYISELKPQVILETGSGLSTLVAAYSLKNKAINGKVYSMEHLIEFLSQTTRSIEEHGLEKYCESSHCPIVEHQIDLKTWKWYDTRGIAELKIDLLVIDGPYGSLQKHARYPALPLLIDQLNKGAIIIVDDTNRKDEGEIVDLWLHEFPRLKKIETITFDTGITVLQYA